MTTEEALRGVSAYPIPRRALEDIARRRGIALDAEADPPALAGAGMALARADVLLWLSYAPNVSQGGQSYTFSDAQRAAMRNEARGLLDLYDDEETATPTPYGYKGSRL